MVSKKKRVTKDVFQIIMKKGGTLGSSFFTMRYMASQDLLYAVVAPKTVVKQANMRNKLRRQGYAILRSFPLKTYAYIFFFKKEAKNKPYSALKEDLHLLLSKIKP